jgi:multidrug efflux pump subunit AcrA (membrane-fusion protein)
MNKFTSLLGCKMGKFLRGIESFKHQEPSSKSQSPLKFGTWNLKFGTLQNIYFYLFCSIIIPLLALIASCGSPADDSTEKATETKTPVTITNVSKENLEETVDFNATSSFLDKSSVRSPISGYIKQVLVNLGSTVKKGDIMFYIQTKEGLALEGNKHDSLSNFTGIIKVIAPAYGQITGSNIQVGDYVQDGQELATISSLNSLVFILEVPYDMHAYVSQGKQCKITLPDNKVITANVGAKLSTIEPLAQTEKYILDPSGEINIPENLVAVVHFTKSIKENALTVPKEALLSDEAQTDWWVMKLINDSIAIKVPVTKGIENDTRIEITSPLFTPTDRIVVTGSYGLPDTAKIQIVK